MQKSFSFRSVAIIVAAAIIIWMVFNEGTLTAILIAGLFFFLGSLGEVYQRREMLEPRRLIMFTAMYTLCLLLIIAVLLWRYRNIFLT
jgi:hypothetical protein